MKLIKLSLLLFLYVLSLHLSAQVTVKDLAEFNQRDGLPNFFKKIKSGKEVSVAYLGGSITEAENGWRDLTFDWLQSYYPQTKFKQINATIGGTGSSLGVFRLDRDVLAFRPDLVFVEFAVNDGNGPAEAIHKSMEGIVRKIWKQDPRTDICFVYTIAENGVQALQSGKYQISAAAMETIAGHYGIPSIHMGVEVVKLLGEGKLIFAGNPDEHPGKIVFTKDKTHPLSGSGHPIYAEAVKRSFLKMEDVASGKAHKLVKAYDPGNWEKAKMIPLSEVAKNDKWQDLPHDNELIKRFSRSISYLTKASSAGASFTVKFKGKILGVYDVIGPESGMVEVVADDKPAVEIERFDPYCTYYRRNAFFVKDLTDGVHEVTFTLSGKALDKAAILAKRNTPFDNPQNYAVNGWLVNNILLVGDLVK
jgi:lysophospholipase L1-like esterase